MEGTVGEAGTDAYINTSHGACPALTREQRYRLLQYSFYSVLLQLSTASPHVVEKLIPILPTRHYGDRASNRQLHALAQGLVINDSSCLRTHLAWHRGEADFDLHANLPSSVVASAAHCKGTSSSNGHAPPLDTLC